VNDQELADVLRLSWQDHRLSRGERKALAQLVDGDAALVGRMRAIAFGVAKEHAHIDGVLEWLEGVVRATSDEVVAPHHDAHADVVFAPHQDVCGLVVRAFDGAHEQVDVCVFTITDDRIATAMLAAHRRGVKIRVISDDLKSGDLGSDIGRFAHAGMKVRVDRSEAHMHHKFAIFDNRLLLNGSYNWTRSAGTENRENCVVSTDPKLIAAFAAELQRVWDAGQDY